MRNKIRCKCVGLEKVFGSTYKSVKIIKKIYKLNNISDIILPTQSHVDILRTYELRTVMVIVSTRIGYIDNLCTECNKWYV